MTVNAFRFICYCSCCCCSSFLSFLTQNWWNSHRPKFVLYERLQAQMHTIFEFYELSGVLLVQPLRNTSSFAKCYITFLNGRKKENSLFWRRLMTTSYNTKYWQILLSTNLYRLFRDFTNEKSQAVYKPHTKKIKIGWLVWWLSSKIHFEFSVYNWLNVDFERYVRFYCGPLCAFAVYCVIFV